MSEKEHEETRSLRSVVVAVVRKVFLLLMTPKIPAYLFNWPASTKLGRKKTLECLCLTCSVSISVLTALIMLLEEGQCWYLC
ncbi:hypothetical protein Pcinc_001811 [Petrolisthes cinctipes]|uniref:Uncharacterized protein n=1 Tax=Petrolisthes cinctipes TaxID=88211 RepID=A0AAE1GK27_PETCI|nr:hypothetical protein Pcinc_001811 [Petrolisthes cinctipes]